MEEIKTITEFFARLFTTQQQAALIIMALCVMVTTHNFKIIFFGLKPERRAAVKTAKIRLFAVCAGILAGIIGSFIGGKEPMWFWLVSGILSSAGSILLVDMYKKWFKRE